MERNDFVFIGIDNIQGAVDVASARRWDWSPAPEAVRRQIARNGHCVALTHDDAPMSVVIIRGDVGKRGTGRHNGQTAFIDLDTATFDETVEDFLARSGPIGRPLTEPEEAGEPG